MDKIESIDSKRIVASKCVSRAEEYLADHFPSFPVLPGVMMLEAVTQAATWVLHVRTNFAKTIAVLKEARNIKYGNFVAPGDTITFDVELLKETSTGATFKVSSLINREVAAISGRIELAYFDIGDKEPGMTDLDERIRADTRIRWESLRVHSAISLEAGVTV